MLNNIKAENFLCFRCFFLPVIILFPALFLSFVDPEEGSRVPEGKKTYTVEWVGVYPSPNGMDKKSFRERITDILLGKKNDSMLKPFGIAADSKENFWVLDQGRGIIFHISDLKPDIPDVYRKKKISHSSLAGICRMDDKLLYTDSRENKIFILSPKKNEVRVLNDSLVLEQPVGIAWSEPEGQIWVVETRAHRITVLDREGRFIKHIGKRGAGKTEFNFPTFIWIDDDGNVYIVDSMNFRLQILDKEGNYINSFGKVGDSSGYFARPKGVATDSHGNIYIADALYNTVQIYDREGNFLYYFGSQGHGKGEFWMPGGIYIDKNDFIYVADTYNARVQIFKLTER